MYRQYKYHIYIYIISNNKKNKECNSNVSSVYYPKVPDTKNTDWLKTFKYENQKWFILGDFNLHSLFLDNHCQKVTHQRFLENIIDFLLASVSVCYVVTSSNLK